MVAINQDTLRGIAADLAAFRDHLMVPSAFGPALLGGILADFQRRDFAALDPSLVALARGKRPPIGRFFWERTKGGSKDSDLATALLWLLAFSRRPLRIQIGANDQQQADEIRLIVRQILRLDAPLNAILAERIEPQTTRIINTATESVAEILTADHRGSHGSRPDMVLVDELSHISNREFAETLLDNADKVPHGIVCIATNAGYLDTWQFDWHEIARTSPRWHFSALTEPAPWVDPADLEESKLRNSAARYNRLWRGIWGRNEGDAIDAADLQAAITIERDSRTAEGDEIFVGGLDLSTKRDHSALVVLAADWRRHRVRLAYCQSWKPCGENGVDLQAVRTETLAVAEKFNCAVAYDPHQAHLLAQDLMADGIVCVPTPFTGPACNAMASALVQGFKERRIDLFDEPELVSDLGRLSIVEKSFGYKLEATHDPNKGHCDRAFAFAIALPPAMEIATTYVPTHDVMRIGGTLCSL